MSDYEVIGQTDAGLLVHKWGGRYHAIEAYDMNNLSLKWNKEVFLPDKKSKVIGIVPYNNELLIFYTLKQKRITYVYARKVSTELHQLMPEVVVDTIQKSFGSYGYSYQLSVSKNKAYICLQRMTNDFNGISSVNCVLLNRNLEILGQKNIPITNKLINEDNFLSNEGEIFLLDAQVKRTIRSNNVLYDNFKLLRFNYAYDKLDQTDENHADFRRTHLGVRSCRADREPCLSVGSHQIQELAHRRTHRQLGHKMQRWTRNFLYRGEWP